MAGPLICFVQAGQRHGPQALQQMRRLAGNPLADLVNKRQHGEPSPESPAQIIPSERLQQMRQGPNGLPSIADVTGLQRQQMERLGLQDPDGIFPFGGPE